MKKKGRIELLKKQKMTIEQIERHIYEKENELSKLNRLIARYSTVKNELSPLMNEIDAINDKIWKIETELKQFSIRIKHMFKPQELQIKQNELNILKKQREKLQNQRNDRLPKEIGSFSGFHPIMLGLTTQVKKIEKEIPDYKSLLMIKLKDRKAKEDKQQKETLKKEKEDKSKARIAAIDKKSRELAGIIRKQIKVYEFCPYCFKEIKESHADHIYPISLGGLSSIKNMVHVCKECNSKKKHMTLREYIETYNLNREKIEDILKKLGKTF
jgi:5-methylcytosine-specific restriction endonuclease McrA